MKRLLWKPLPKKRPIEAIADELRAIRKAIKNHAARIKAIENELDISPVQLPGGSKKRRKRAAEPEPKAAEVG